MAKIRVYELARDLNMQNKELLDKLEDLNIPVRSHMSSLDDDTVAQIKAGLRGKKAETVEITRVKPTVIRKRKKKVKEKPPAEAEQVEMEPVEAEVEQGEAAPIEAKAEKPSEQSRVSPPETEAVETKSAEEKRPAAREQKRETKPALEARHMVKKKKKIQDTSSAKIISRPEPVKTPEQKPEPEKLEEDRAAAKTEAEKGPEPEKTPRIDEEASQASEPEQKTAEPKAEAPEEKTQPEAKQAQEEEPEPTRVPEPEVEKAQTDKDEKVAEAPAAKEVTPKPETQEAPKGKARKGKQKPPKKKKGKKETPAKIIKLPTAPPVTQKEAQEETPEQELVKSEMHDTPQKPDAVEMEQPQDRTAERKKKKRPRQADEEEKDRKFFKKKISFRHKEVVEGDALYGADKRSRKGKKGAKAKAVKGQKTQITTPKAIKRRIKIDDAIMLSDLAKRMGIKANDMIVKLMSLGVMATVNQTIDFDTAALVAAEFGYEVERASFEEEAILKAQKEEDTDGRMQTRPPVVTIMGHVDHGKTSLLDVIRKTRITEGEAGGITQHIGAYNVQIERGQIVFLDTPGHEAFTAMRARGAKVTDIVVLVVAADDGVMPQTIEAINHAKASNVPIIVAVNKIDKNNAEPDRVQRELAEQGLTPEDWGGETIFVKVSAKKNIGIDDLLEMILLQSEMLELKAIPDKLATGNVIEAKLDSGRGPVATVLVREGTLHAGEPIVCGVHYGKIRAMLNDRGQNVEEAGPSMPVEILGLTGVPEAGDELVALTDERDAKTVSSHRIQKQRSVELAKTSRLSLEKLYERMQEDEIKELNLIIKADVHGSIEALKDSLTKLSNEEVKIKVIHAATGTITESDVSLAAVSNAIIIGFNVRPTPKVTEYAQEEHVDIRFYNVIYNAIKEIKDAIVGMMSSTYEERVLGRAEVRDTFHVPKVGTIAGCYVTDGKMERGQSVRLLRDGVVVYEGKISSLKRYKDDQKEVMSGYECGVGIDNFNDIKIGDVLECFFMEEIKPELK